MKDLTLIYYTANYIPHNFAENVIDHLLDQTDGLIPVVSVSHKPVALGKNICLGDIGRSAYNIFKQVLIGAKAAKTKYIACCEDDSLYHMEHFSYRPKPGHFAYNVNRLNLAPARTGGGAFYFKRTRCGLCMCIAETDLMVEVLEARFKKYPQLEGTPLGYFCAEPGRQREEGLGLKRNKLETFETKSPALTFSHKHGLGGKRKTLPTDVITKTDPFWGDATELWNKIHG